MLIVNQKRDIVINFSNVLSIYVQENNVQTLISCIEDALILGKYKTEERAKEVLQEIVEAIESWEDLKTGQPYGIPSFKYKMPKE